MTSPADVEGDYDLRGYLDLDERSAPMSDKARSATPIAGTVTAA